MHISVLNPFQQGLRFDTGAPKERIFLPLLSDARLFLEAAGRQQTSYSPNASAKESCKDIAESNHRESYQLMSCHPVSLS